jgi:hypothetical protein
MEVAAGRRTSPLGEKQESFPPIAKTWLLNRKDNSPWDPWRSHEACINVTVYKFSTLPWCGNLNPLPFRSGRASKTVRCSAETEPDLRPRSLRFAWSFPDSLGPTNLRPIAISAKPFSTTVLKVLT